MKWQPIETAPKDRSFLIAENMGSDKKPNWFFDVAWWEGAFFSYIIDSRGPDHFIAVEPDAMWCELPNPPESA
jgi:hypothetical protein